MQRFPGTVWHMHMLALALASSLGSCSAHHAPADEADEEPPLDPDDEEDNEAPPDPFDEKDCDKRERAYFSFLEAHRACSQDDDCAVIGNCSDSDFDAVRSDAAEEATRKRATLCGHSADGPVYQPVCRAQKCELKQIENACCGCDNGDAGSFF